MSRDSVRGFSSKENLNAGLGSEGFSVITSSDGATAGRFYALVPYDGTPVLSASSRIANGDDLPEGVLVTTVFGDFDEVTVTSGTVLAYNY